MPGVLVVEDDVLIRQSIGEFLETEGYAIASVSNGKAAFDMLNDGWRPDLILLDLMMPVMNGEEFRTEQLRRPELAGIPVVVLTGDGMPAEKARRLGAAGYLEKPFQPDALLGLVAGLL